MIGVPLLSPFFRELCIGWPFDDTLATCSPVSDFTPDFGTLCRDYSLMISCLSQLANGLGVDPLSGGAPASLCLPGIGGQARRLFELEIVRK